MTEAIKSPCINVCALDENDVCVGCFRSMREITDWSEYSSDRKRDVVAQAQQRMKRHYNLV